jgi:hypothetical protein
MSDRIIAATRKGVFHIERSGATWRIARTSFLGDNCSMVLPDGRDGSLYAALGHGHFGVKLHRSTDGGATWEQRSAPQYPAKPEGLADQINPTNQKPIPWSLELIWELAIGGPQETGVLWCGTIPGGLFRSDDAGRSWSLNRPLWDDPDRLKWFGGGADLPGIHSICVDPHDARRVAVGVSCGGVWLTEDGGKTWQCRADGMWAAYMPPEQAKDPNIQDVHRLLQCPAQPTKYWVQHHNGIFRSSDALKSWQEIEDVQPSTFGFALAVHPDDGDTAWFVPGIDDEKRIPVDGKLVVTRTRDGGKTFDVLSAGLPQEHAYDLTYRHGMDVDESGTRLTFGTTTGSLFVSEDSGESWQVVSTHLPPVYCVRFV